MSAIVLGPRAIATRRIVPASPKLRRIMSAANKPNASGLTPEHSKALPERPAEEAEKKIISAIKEVSIYPSPSPLLGLVRFLNLSCNSCIAVGLRR